MIKEINTQEQDRARIDSMMNVTEMDLVDLHTQVDNLTQHYQKLFSLHQKSCIKEQRVCNINAKQVGIDAQYYWAQCSTDAIFINKTVSLFSLYNQHYVCTALHCTHCVLISTIASQGRSACKNRKLMD